jgi:SOS response regulatory protein OraA/RecX
MPRDAEAWLAERGIEREVLVVEPEPEPAAPDPATPSPGAVEGTAAPAAAGTPPHTTGVSVRDAQRVARQAAADAELREADAAALPDPEASSLADDIARAVAFIRRSTSVAPQSEGRIREKLEGRELAPAVIEGALERARAERLVDDRAMAMAFVEERRAKGHAAARLRTDLRARGFTDELIAEVLASTEREDPNAAAFALAHERASRLTGVASDTAFRRIAGYLARCGYPEGVARKAARDAVFATRDAEHTAGR